MKFKIVIIFLVCIVGTYAAISSQQDIRQAKKGLAYIKNLEKRKTTTIKLKKYFLAQKKEKPFFFANYDEVYTLFLTGF